MMATMASAGQQSESLNLLVDSIPALIHTARPDGCIDYFNRPGLDYLGATLDDVTGWKWTAFVDPEDVDGIVAQWRACLVSGENFEYETRIRRANGEYLWHLVRGVPLRDEAGNIVKWYGVVTDIEDRKRAEDTIREQERELRQMLDLSSQQVAVFGPGGERLYEDRIGLDYVGLSLEEWRQTPGNFFRTGWFIHSDDQERAARAYSDGTRSSGSAYELELRVRGADGNYRWFLFRFNPLHDDKGQVKRWYVASTIDERKQAEDTLRRENVALREEIDKASMFKEIVGTSPALKAVLSRISKVAPSDSTVLITGRRERVKSLLRGPSTDDPIAARAHSLA
jgi:formate hydrogenlyase transcriptional activator